MKKDFWYYAKLVFCIILVVVVVAEMIALPIVTIAYTALLLSDWDLSPEGRRVVIVLAFFLIYYIGKRSC